MSSARHRNATSLPPCRLCASGSDSLEHALLFCTAHHSARQRWLQQSSGTCPLSMVLALPATSRMLHTFAKPLRRAKYEHVLRAWAGFSCTYLLKRVALLLVCVVCFAMLIISDNDPWSFQDSTLSL